MRYKVIRHTNLAYNKLKNLIGSPEYVGGFFYCSNNILDSVEGAPKEVGRNFVCYSNPRHINQEEVLEVCDVKGMIY